MSTVTNAVTRLARRIAQPFRQDAPKMATIEARNVLGRDSLQVASRSNDFAQRLAMLDKIANPTVQVETWRKVAAKAEGFENRLLVTEKAAQLKARPGFSGEGRLALNAEHRAMMHELAGHRNVSTDGLERLLAQLDQVAGVKEELAIFRRLAEHNEGPQAVTALARKAKQAEASWAPRDRYNLEMGDMNGYEGAIPQWAPAWRAEHDAVLARAATR